MNLEACISVSRRRINSEKEGQGEQWVWWTDVATVHFMVQIYACVKVTPASQMTATMLSTTWKRTPGAKQGLLLHELKCALNLLKIGIMLCNGLATLVTQDSVDQRMVEQEIGVLSVFGTDTLVAFYLKG